DILEQEPHGIHENFFARGGHSLLATRLIARLQSVLGIRLAVRTLFETPTIAGLARQVALALRGEQQLTEPVLLPVARHELLPLSFAQQRLWFLDQLDPGNIAYLIPTARRLEGALKVRALERALSYLIQRHESLRTTFRLHADQPVQVIHPAVSFVLPLIDLRGLEQPARERQVRTLAAQEMQVPCDLSTGPLLRCSLLRLRGEDHVLLFTLHHIISDAWSGEI